MVIGKWKAVFAVATAVLLAASGVWASPAAEEGSSGDMAPSEIDTNPVYGGNLVTADNTWTSVWDPTVLIHGIQVVPAIYDQLFEFDIAKGPRGTGEYTLEDHNWLALGALRGQVIESNEVISPTQMKWTVRRGIHYHNRPPANGRELTREDVLVTWATVAAEPRSGLMYKGDEMLRMTADPSDDWTINVEMADPDTLGLWAYIITSLNGVLPAEYWQDTSINREDWRNHMGSGPYWPTEVVEGSHITYAKNPDYWQTDPLNPGNQLPYLDTMQIVAFADGAARVAALRSGKLDRMVVPGMTPVELQALQRSNPEIQTGPSWTLGQYAAVRADLEPWSDIRVRHAAMMAVNHAELQEFHGEHYSYPAFPTKPSVGKPEHLSKEELDEIAPDIGRLYGYHPDEAEKLLDEAGYPRGDDGIRFETSIIADPQTAQYYEAFMGYLEDVGIRVNFNMIPNGAHYAAVGGAAGPNDEVFTGLAAHDHGATSIGILGIAFWNAPYRPFYSMGRIQGSPEALEAERLWLDVNKATFGSDEHTRLWQELHLFWMNQQWFLDFGAINTYQAWQPWVKGKAGMSGYATAQYHFTKYFWIDAAQKMELSGRAANE